MTFWSEIWYARGNDKRAIHTMVPNISNLQRKGKLVLEIGELEKSGVKLQCSTEDWETTSVSRYLEAQKID